jgi:hypothetical protein
MLIGAICACILGYALIQLFRNRQTRSTAVNIAVAFGLLGTIAIQERIEQTVALPSWMVGIRAGIEEGTELTAVLLILFVLVRQRQHTLDTADTIVPNLLRCVHWPVLLSAGLILHVIISLANAQYVNVGGVANPVVWYPSVLFLVLASTYFHKIPVAAHEHTRWRILLATFFLLASAGSMYAISPRGSTSLLSIFGESTFFYIWAVGVVAGPVLLAQWAGFRVNTVAQIALLFALLLGFTILRFLPIYAFQYSLAGVISYMITNIFLHTASQHIPPEQVTGSPFPSYIKGK